MLIILAPLLFAVLVIIAVLSVVAGVSRARGRGFYFALTLAVWLVVIALPFFSEVIGDAVKLPSAAENMGLAGSTNELIQHTLAWACVALLTALFGTVAVVAIRSRPDARRGLMRIDEPTAR